MWRIVSPPLPMTRPSLPLTSISMVALPVSGSMVNSGVRGASAGGRTRREPRPPRGRASWGTWRARRDRRPSACASSRRHGTPRVRSSRRVSSSGGVSVAAFAPASPGGGAGEGVGVSRPDPRFRTLTSSGARRVARGRGARRRASRAKTAGSDAVARAGRETRCLRATVSPRAPEASSPSGSAPAPSSASDASSRDTSAAFRPDVSRPRDFSFSRSCATVIFATVIFVIEVSAGARSSRRARGCAPKSPPFARSSNLRLVSPSKSEASVSPQIIMCDIPFGGRFLSEGGEFNNSHRKSSA